MDRHTLEQVSNQIDELARHGSSSCMRQARSLMCENFNQIVNFALSLSKLPSKPKHTIADNYPAGGLAHTEPCMFCEDFEKLQAENGQLKTITGLLCSGCDTEIKDELSGCKLTFCNKCLVKIEQALKGE